jgi:hypothetical protein
MNSPRIPAELDLLWRLTGRRTPGQHAEALGSKFETIRPRILEMMLEMAILELGEEVPTVQLTKDEIAILLDSRDLRVRVIGVRLLPYSSE